MKVVSFFSFTLFIFSFSWFIFHFSKLIFLICFIFRPTFPPLWFVELKLQGSCDRFDWKGPMANSTNVSKYYLKTRHNDRDEMTPEEDISRLGNVLWKTRGRKSTITMNATARQDTCALFDQKIPPLKSPIFWGGVRPTFFSANIFHNDPRFWIPCDYHTWPRFFRSM